MTPGWPDVPSLESGDTTRAFKEQLMPSGFSVMDPPDIRILMNPELILEDRKGALCHLISSSYMPDRQAWSYETRDLAGRVTKISSLIGHQILGEATPARDETDVTASEKMNVILQGGPAGLPHHERLRYVSQATHDVKVPYGNGYEHFAPTHTYQKVNEHHVAVFRWTGTTKIAE
jgi:hypothetical protein